MNGLPSVRGKRIMNALHPDQVTMASAQESPQILDVANDPSLRRFFWLSALTLSGIGAINFFIHLYGPTPSLLRTITSGLLALFGLTALAMLRNNKPAMAFKTMLWGGWLVCCIVAAVTGGVRSNYVAVYPLVIIFAGWSLGTRYGILFSLLTAAYLAVLAYLGAYDQLPEQHGGPIIVPALIGMGVVALSTLASYLYSTAYFARLRQLESREAERIRQEQALQESEGRFRRLLDKLESIAVQGYAPDGTVNYWNAGSEKIYGYAANEALGANLLDLIIPPAMRDEARSHILHMADTGEGAPPGELTLQRREGTPVPVYSSHAVVTKENGVVDLFCLDIDLTQRKRAENDLKNIMENAGDAIWTSDLSGQYLYGNPAACALTGHRLDELLRLNITDLLAPKHHARLPEHLARISVPGTVLAGCWKARHKDGHEIDVELTTQRLPDDRYLAIGRDITERRAKDQELERHRNHLAELVHERTVELVAAREEAERLARVKSEFLANMSHEIRTPLNGILGLARIGAGRASNADEAPAIFSRILHSGKLLLGIINDILDFSKLEAGKFSIESIPTDPAAILEESVALLQEEARMREIGIVLHTAPDFPASCLSDPLRLRQIFLNLISNGIKFTQQGTIQVGAGVDGDYLCFSFSDTGIGMSAEQMERIFAPFEQADGSTTRKFGGTGLGLSITQRIVALMEGDIRMTSEPGVGSCFEIRLPYLASPAIAASEPAGVPQPDQDGGRLTGIRILVAEDNEINQMVLAESLRDENAQFVMASNGREAVERFIADGEEAFDIVLMDIQMPEMDGYEATTCLLGIAPGFPVVGQTAHAYGEERDRCFAVGMVGHIAKPIDPDQLVAIILKHARPRSGV